MSGIIHGDNCDCCKNLSPIVRQSMIEVQKLMDGISQVKGSSELSEKSLAIKNLEDVATELAPLGGIDDIVAIGKEFFSVDFTSIDFSKSGFDPNGDTPDSLIGPFKLKDISDNPTINVKKLMRFNGLDLSKLSKLKMSFTIPTLIIEKSLNVGPATLGIKFFISLKEVSWTPAISADFDSIEKALAELKKVSKNNPIKKLLDPTTPKKLKDLKDLAKTELGATNPAIFSNLSEAKTNDEFFQILDKEKLNLYEEIDIGAEYEKQYEEKKKSEENIKKNLEKEVGGKLVKTSKDLKNLDLCGKRRTFGPKFNANEVQDVIPCAANKLEEEAKANVLAAKASNELKEIADLIKDLPAADENEKQIEKVKSFLSCVDGHNTVMQDYNNKKLSAVAKYYNYKEAEALHKFIHTYVTKRFQSVSPYNPPYVAIFQERDRLLTERAAIGAKVIKADQELGNLINAAGYTNTTVNSNQLPLDVSAISAGTYVTYTSENEAIKAKQEVVSNYISEYNALTEQIIAKADEYNQSVTDFNQGVEAEINGIVTAYQTPANSPLNPNQSYNPITGSTNTIPPAGNKVIALRRALYTGLNTISNLVGFNLSGEFNLLVDTKILKIMEDEEFAAKGPFTSYVTPPSSFGSQVISGGEFNNTFKNYFKLSTYDFNPYSSNEKRKGFLEENVWKKYYSPLRIDELFTWQEQGYTAPKPTFDDKGNPLGAKEKTTIVNGEGATQIMDVPVSVKECQVNLEVAIPFWDNLEPNTKIRVNKLLNEIVNSVPVSEYLTKVEYIATLEAKLYYGKFLSKVDFNQNINTFELTVPQKFEYDYIISKRIYEAISKKIAEVESEIEDLKAKIAQKQKDIEGCAKKFADGAGAGGAGGAGSNNVKLKCKAKLGSDPNGLKPPSGECPNYTKNCYWEEYTKMMQIVSLMPIPDVKELYKRLFRYYPVALQIPLPAPPGVLPTLAAGIPDPQISIPLPFIWKHIITIQTPMGLFVVWIALAGGFIPNPYIMLIDEKMQSSFIFTPKGITPIPANQLLVTPIEKQSLFDLIPGLNDTLRIDLSSPLGKLIAGSTRLDATNPDAPKTVIDNLKGKIKKSIDDLSIPDPPWAGDSDRAKELKEKIKKINDIEVPSNPAELFAILDQVLTEIFKLAAEGIDKIKISAIKIPKNSKGMMMELPPVIDMLETVMTLIDSALNAPADATKVVLGAVGASIKVIDVKEKLNSLVRQETDKPEIQTIFDKINAEIEELEARLPQLPPEEVEKIRAQITERTKIVKKAVIEPLKKVANAITPEMLGFVATVSAPLPLPAPCYTNVVVPPVPPYILLAMALIKQAPSLLEAFPDSVIADAVAGVLDLSKALPSVIEIFQAAINKLLALLPDLILPAGADPNMLKNIKDALKNFLLSFKLRLPKVGQPVQLIIPPSLIKSLIKEAVNLFLQALKAVLINYVVDFLNKEGPERVAKVTAFLTVIKLLLGVELHKISGKEIKAFIQTTIESVAYPPLDQVNSIISIATSLKAEFKSIMELFTKPDPTQFPPIKKEGPFIEVGTNAIKGIVDPIFIGVLPAVSNALPFPVILLGAAAGLGPILTKIHPLKAVDKVPAWEGISLKNIPYVLWLDQLIATAQRGALLQSDYVAPYSTPLTP